MREFVFSYDRNPGDARVKAGSAPGRATPLPRLPGLPGRADGNRYDNNSNAAPLGPPFGTQNWPTARDLCKKTFF